MVVDKFSGTVGAYESSADKSRGTNGTPSRRASTKRSWGASAAAAEAGSREEKESARPQKALGAGTLTEEHRRDEGDGPEGEHGVGVGGDCAVWAKCRAARVDGTEQKTQVMTRVQVQVGAEDEVDAKTKEKVRQRASGKMRKLRRGDRRRATWHAGPGRRSI